MRRLGGELIGLLASRGLRAVRPAGFMLLVTQREFHDVIIDSSGQPRTSGRAGAGEFLIDGITRVSRRETRTPTWVAGTAFWTGTRGLPFGALGLAQYVRPQRGRISFYAGQGLRDAIRSHPASRGAGTLARVNSRASSTRSCIWIEAPEGELEARQRELEELHLDRGA